MNKEVQLVVGYIVMILCIADTMLFGYTFNTNDKDTSIELSVVYKPESFFGENIASFNKYDQADRILYSRHLIDGVIDLQCGPDKENPFLRAKAGVRNKATWGTVEGPIKTTTSTFKIYEVVTGEHSHSLPRNISWMREAFIDIDLSTAFGLPFKSKHSMRLGAFPYQLGRGIALGDAYAVGPDSLGFWTESSVDQFAYGLLFTNELVKDILTHELYVALLQNKSSSLSDTNAKILGQQYDRLNSPKRQFGSANFVISGSLKWQAIEDTVNNYNLFVQPYWLFNRDSEQTIEFLADAQGILGTVGLASEFEAQKFEFGFDCAINMGRQKVKGWDRNKVIHQLRDGVPTVVNSHVYAGDPTDQSSARLIYVLGSNTQKSVDQAFRSSLQNGKEIVGVIDGLTGGSSVFNAVDRFRDPYVNVFNGWMAVADAGYWFAEDTVRVAGMAAIASGDEFPNFKPVDDSYSGFIGLQETYSGDRVKSAFFLGSGKPKRPYSQPTFGPVPDKFLNVAVSGFSNLMLIGTSVLWQPISVRKTKLHTNIVAFWQDAEIGNARRYLGFEGNLFFSCKLLKNLELFSVGSFFVPGSYYTDRKDTAFLTPVQIEISDELDVTGYGADPIPGLNDNVAFTFNVGLKFSF